MGGRESGISGDLKVGYAWAGAPHSGSKAVARGQPQGDCTRKKPPISTAPPHCLGEPSPHRRAWQRPALRWRSYPKACVRTLG